MSYNLVQADGSLKNIAGGSGGGAIVEGKPIYGERKQYDTNKKMPLAGQAALKYTMDRDGILTGSCHKQGQGYSAFMHMNGKQTAVFDNYSGESCSFDFPSVRVKAGDVIELTTNVPTTETANFFWLNNIGVTPIVGVEPGIELQIQDTYSLEEIKVGTWIDGKPIYRKVFIGSWTAKAGTWTATDISTVGFETLVSASCKRNEKEGNLPFAQAEMGDNTLNLAASTGTYTIKQIILEYTKTTD